jgi:site-specific recombinase XerD
MQVYFYPKQSKGATLSWTLYVKIIINGEVSELSSGLKVDPETWDKDNDIMEFTHNIRKKLIRVHNSLVAEKSVITSSVIKAAYSDKNIETHTVMVELSKMIERCKTEVKLGDRSKSSLQRHYAFSSHLENFLLSKGLTDITFDQVSVSFLQELETYFKTKVCGHNTTKKQMDIIRKLYHYAKANGWATKEPFYFYKITEKVVKKEALTEDELTRIIHKNFAQRLDNVRSVFIVQCFTGLAYADIKALDQSAIYLDADANPWIDSSRVKTGVDFDIPVLPMLIPIFEKYDYKLPVPSNQKMNDYLKEIGGICGIDKVLTTHMARRTFASLMNNKGVNITAIQQMLGHNRITTTQHYITTNRGFLKQEMTKAHKELSQLFDPLRPPSGAGIK